MPTIHPQSRTPVLCLHASATTGRAWNGFSAPLRERCDMLTPDRFGYGASECWPVGRPTSFDAEADHLAPLLNARPQGVHLIGHSFGGAVALQMALRWPARVKSLTVYEPTRFALLFGTAETEEAGQAIVAIGRTVGMLVLSGRHAEAAALFVDYWSGEGAWLAMDERRREAVARHMPKVRAEFEAAFSDRVPLAAWRRLTMPVHLITGEASPLPVRQIAERLMTCLPQARFVTLPGIGHMGPLTHPAQVLRHLPGALQPIPQPLAA